MIELTKCSSVIKKNSANERKKPAYIYEDKFQVQT